VETRRGCAQRCIYCADPLAHGSQVRLRPRRAVAAEMLDLIEQGIEYFHLCDSEFNLPEDHAIGICEGLSRAGVAARAKWFAYCAPQPFSSLLAEKMVEAGCRGVNFGVDSGSNAMLMRLGRNLRKDGIRRMAEACHQAGLTFMCDLLFGGPGDSPEQVQETIDLMREIQPDCAGAAIGVRIYPGTGLAEIVRAEGLHEGNPNLRGAIAGNESLLQPIYYLTSALGPNPEGLVRRIIGNDSRFFSAAGDSAGQNYNYDDNALLCHAIASGHRGAYWDILRRVNAGLPPLT
jgi:tryptophan 2-C-methyltransferase